MHTTATRKITNGHTAISMCYLDITRFSSVLCMVLSLPFSIVLLCCLNWIEELGAFDSVFCDQAAPVATRKMMSWGEIPWEDNEPSLHGQSQRIYRESCPHNCKCQRWYVVQAVENREYNPKKCIGQCRFNDDCCDTSVYACVFWWGYGS